MALPPPKHNEMGAFYLVFGVMELSAGLGYTTTCISTACNSGGHGSCAAAHRGAQRRAPRGRPGVAWRWETEALPLARARGTAGGPPRGSATRGSGVSWGHAW